MYQAKIHQREPHVTDPVNAPKWTQLQILWKFEDIFFNLVVLLNGEHRVWSRLKRVNASLQLNALSSLNLITCRSPYTPLERLRRIKTRYISALSASRTINHAPKGPQD
ncbi:unnamed protein product [Leuciscus chuanchicus]